MMADYFRAHEAVTLTKHDTNPLARRPEALLVAVAGNAVVQAYGSAADITLTGLAAGQIIPLSIGYLRSTGTTATLVGLW
jgi:hypothetical protein